MQNTWILSLTLLFQVGPVLAQSELRTYVGSITEDKHYSISMLGFGIEQFEGGKRTTHRFQLWDLLCNYPPDPLVGQPNETYCHVERTVLNRSGEDMGLGTYIGQYLHSTLDGSLKLTNVDWNEGELDFQLILVDRTTIEVKLRVGYQDTSIYLKDFKAIGIARGIVSDTMEAIEYRIPEYTYTLDIPVRMKGLKSESDKRQEEMLQSLSQQDRAIWEQLEDKTPPSSFLEGHDFDQRLRQIIPEYDAIKAGERELTPEEERKTEGLILAEIRKWLERQGFSVEGLQKIFDFMSEGLSK